MTDRFDEVRPVTRGRNNLESDVWREEVRQTLQDYRMAIRNHYIDITHGASPPHRG
jgi:hypothetical protein